MLEIGNLGVDEMFSLAKNYLITFGLGNTYQNDPQDVSYNVVFEIWKKKSLELEIEENYRRKTGYSENP